MLKQVRQFITENLMLVIIMVCVTINILSRAYFDMSFISSDSAHYLRAAREILRGNGFNVYPGWFAGWPIGYPVLIALVAFITRTEIYLASKILSIIIIWIIGILLYKRFGRLAWIYSLVMLNVGFRYIFYYTWSETVFILGLFLLAFTVVDIITTDEALVSQYIRLTFIVLLLFMTRYIGAFALMIVGLLWLGNLGTALKNKCKLALLRLLYLSVSGIFSLVFISVYLLTNLNKTGYIAGIPRVPGGPMRELFLDLFRAMMIEMDFAFDTFFSIGSARLALLLWFVLIGFMWHGISKNKDAILNREKDIITTLCFILIGIIYLAAIIVMRFVSYFDDFGFRLLFPGTAMLFIGFISLLVRNKKISEFVTQLNGKVIPLVLISGFLLMTLFFIPRLQGTSGYHKTKEAVLSTYELVPDGALVLWGDIAHLLFMRDNLDALHQINGDDITSFFDEYSAYPEIYIFVPGLQTRLHETVDTESELYSFFAQYLGSSDVFIRIK